MKYKDIGWLIPILKGGKVPARKWKTEEGEVRDFKREDFEGCDWGIVPGEGVVVVDVDNKDGRNGSLSLEVLGLEIGETLTQKTKSGWHLFYRAGGGLGVCVDVLD